MVLMTNTATVDTVAVTLAPSTLVAGRIEVLIDGELAGTVKDGGHIIRNADAVLRAARVYRSAGYDLDAAGNLAAAAVRLA